MTISAPPEFAKAAIPLNWLAQDDTFASYNVAAGDEMTAPSASELALVNT